MLLNIESGINAKATFHITLKSYSTSVLWRVSIHIFQKFLNLHPFIGKSLFTTYQNTGQCLCSATSAKFLKVLYKTVYKVLVKHQIFFSKNKFGFRKTELQSLFRWIQWINYYLRSKRKNMFSVLFLITLLASTHSPA